MAGITDAEGAEVALMAIKLKSELDEGWFEDEYSLRTTYTMWEYDPQNPQANAYGSVKVEGRFKTYLDCSDTFFWGSADAEELTLENFPILERTVTDIKPLADAANAEYNSEIHKHGNACTVAYGSYRSEHPDHSDEEWWDASGNPKQYKRPEYSAELKAAGELEERLKGSVSDLFSARVRSQRPQGAAYKVRYPESLWEFFNAAGPERETGFGNPKKIGQ